MRPKTHFYQLPEHTNNWKCGICNWTSEWFFHYFMVWLFKIFQFSTKGLIDNFTTDKFVLKSDKFVWPFKLQLDPWKAVKFQRFNWRLQKTLATQIIFAFRFALINMVDTSNYHHDQKFRLQNKFKYSIQPIWRVGIS